MLLTKNQKEDLLEVAQSWVYSCSENSPFSWEEHLRDSIIKDVVSIDWVAQLEEPTDFAVDVGYAITDAICYGDDSVPSDCFDNLEVY